ncbi:hypothetical protein [Pseudanabaena sp. FACHB-2040]|uniref:hypothetical protein n=1 Tax=Pseudanabaena sp. FACHB-2040 TaxID=2692859 RepID=UPI0016859B93|nr:hypothetical protein [Pseudanabaena sp. FACHB-2040]MBD2261248.1 hypothetical protein [Pseudanabaena sp. FACHB-2040]
MDKAIAQYDMAAPTPLTTAKQITLQDLKAEVIEAWGSFAEFQGFLPQVDEMKKEIRRQFGDLRYRRIWEQAYSYYGAMFWISCNALEAYETFTRFFCKEDAPDWAIALMPDALDVFLAHSEGIQTIRSGLEQLLYYNDPKDWDQSEHFFNLIREKEGPVREATEHVLSLRSGRLPATK